MSTWVSSSKKCVYLCELLSKKCVYLGELLSKECVYLGELLSKKCVCVCDVSTVLSSCQKSVCVFVMCLQSLGILYNVQYTSERTQKMHCSGSDTNKHSICVLLFPPQCAPHSPTIPESVPNSCGALQPEDCDLFPRENGARSLNCVYRIAG